MVIINKEKEALTNSKLLSTVTEMIVNENKQYSAFKLKKNRKTYSDHNAILLKLNLITAIEKQKKNNNYQILDTKIYEQIDREADKWNVKEKHNSKKL